MAEIDEKVPEKYGITVSRLMENAGYQIAEFIRKEVDPECIAVYAGKGNNGGDALVAARRLVLWGYDVEVVLLTEELDGIRKEELEILKELDVDISLEEPRRNFSTAVDGLIGYSLKGDPRPPLDKMINEVNNGYETVISIDVPSGVESDTGEKLDPHVNPDYTVTLAMPKTGINKENSGEIWVADISVPPQAYRDLGFELDLFKESSLVKMNDHKM